MLNVDICHERTCRLRSELREAFREPAECGIKCCTTPWFSSEEAFQFNLNQDRLRLLRLRCFLLISCSLSAELYRDETVNKTKSHEAQTPTYRPVL